MYKKISKNTEDVFDEDVEFATERNDKKIVQILTMLICKIIVRFRQNLFLFILML